VAVQQAALALPSAVLQIPCRQPCLGVLAEASFGFGAWPALRLVNVVGAPYRRPSGP